MGGLGLPRVGDGHLPGAPADGRQGPGQRRQLRRQQQHGGLGLRPRPARHSGRDQVRIAYVKNGLLYFISGQASLAVSANFLLKIASPPAVAGYDGWVPLIDTGGTPRPFLETAGLAADGYGCAWKRWLAFGEDYTE